MDNRVESMEKQDDLRPTWSYATRKTLAKGLLNGSLLLSNATQLKAVFNIKDQDGFWVVSLIFILISIVLQVVEAILIVILGFHTPKSAKNLSWATKCNTAITVLAVVIGMVNIIISAFGFHLAGTAE